MNRTHNVIIENQRVKLSITSDGIAESLIFKPADKECLIFGKRIPFSTVTQPRPYQNEVKLAYPCKRTTFKANTVRRAGDKLIIGYELIPWEAVVAVKITADYMAFTLASCSWSSTPGVQETEPGTDIG